MKSITLLFLLLVTALFSSGQDKFYYNSYNEIHCLQVQDDNLWAGTTKGLVLRDKITGELCGIFNTSNSPIPTNHVYDLKIGPDGDLWIATHENVVRFDGNNFTVEAEGLVTEIAFDDQGQLMKATRIYTDICLLNFATSEILGTTPFVSSVVSNISGQNYFTERELFCSGSSSGGGCSEVDIRIKSLSGMDTITIDQNPQYAHPIVHMNIDSSGNLYLIRNGKNELELFIKETQSFQFFDFDSLGTSFGSFTISDSSFDPEGNFWMATNKGVLKFDGNNFSHQDDGLIVNNVTTIEIDEDGNRYVGYLSGGIQKMEGSVWGELWLDGFLSNRLINMSTNSSGKTAFGSYAGVCILEDDNFESFHPENSIITGGETYVDELNNIFVHPFQNEDILYFHDGLEWSILDHDNSNLSIENFEFISSDTSGQVWIKAVPPLSSPFAGARFENGIWTNFTTLDSLYEDIPEFRNPWRITEFAALFIENNDTTVYPIPDSFSSTHCLKNSVISPEGFGLAAISMYTCNSFAFQEHELFYFDGSSWTKISESDGNYLIPQMGIRGEDIFMVESPAFYQCGPARIKIIQPNLQITELLLPASDSILLSESFVLKFDEIEILKDHDENLWLRNLTTFGGICTGDIEYSLNPLNVQMLKLDIDNELTQIEAVHCNSFEDVVNNFYIGRDGSIWNYGARSVYSLSEPTPIFETFTCGNICNNSMVSCVTSGEIMPYEYLWSDGQEGPFGFNIPEGTYSITATDANSQSLTNQFEINEVNSITLALTLDNDGQGIQFISPIISGGQSPFSFTWSDGTTDSLLINPTSTFYQLTIIDGNGCEVQESIEIDITTSINESRMEDQYSVYPNPVKSVLFIKSATCDLFKLTNMMGQQYRSIKNQNPNNSQQLKTQDLPSGIYFLNGFRMGKRVWTEKVVVL